MINWMFVLIILFYTNYIFTQLFSNGIFAKYIIIKIEWTNWTNIVTNGIQMNIQ